MVSLSTFPGYSATILVGSVPVVEHEDIDEPIIQHNDTVVRNYQAARTVSTWIESKDNETFSIQLSAFEPLIDATKTKNKMQYTKLKAYISVDGHHAWISECQRKWFNNRPGQAVRTRWTDEVLGPKQGKGRGCELRKFKFAKIETNSDDASMTKIQRLADRPKKVGMLEIKVYSETAGKEGGDTTAKFSNFKGDLADVPEKALKGDAKSHGTALAEVEKAPRGLVSRTEKKDGDDYPLVIFRFMYRSQEALKQLLIIPRTPSPAPSRSSSREPSLELQGGTYGIPGLEKLVDSLVQKALAGKGKAGGSGGIGNLSTAQLKKIKKEHCEDRGQGGRSGGRRASKRFKDTNGELVMVDLTGDDDDDDDEEEEEGGEDNQSLFVS